MSLIIIFDEFKASLLNKNINFYNPPPKKQTNKKNKYIYMNGIVYNVTKAFYFRSMLIFGSFYSSESESESALFAKCAQTHKEFVVVPLQELELRPKTLRERLQRDRL